MADVTATEAARNFSRLLDEVEHHGRSYTVVRGGRAVASVVPVGPRSMTVGELLDVLRAAPRPDDEYAEDVRAARRALPPPGDPWES